MEAHLLGDKIDTVSGHHVKGGMGDVYDASYTEDKGKAYSQQSIDAPAYEAADDDVKKETHISLNFNHQIPSSQ
jgi:uncharacterized protein YjbJ (UPF0337 family)